MPTSPSVRSDGLAERSALIQVDLDELHANPRQPRQEMDERKLRELMVSITANGLLQPILVHRSSSPGLPAKLTVVAGHRRLEAFRRLKAAAPNEPERSRYSAIPALEYPLDLHDDGALLALVENIQRADLSPLEEAQGLARIRDLRPDLESARELSAATGLTEDRIRRLTRLLDAPQAVKDGLTKGILVSTLRIEGKQESTTSSKERRHHVRLELMTALEFQKLHKHLLSRLPPKAADLRVRRAIERALEQGWSKERVAAFVKAAIKGKEREETGSPPGYRSTPKQLVLYRERLSTLDTADRQILRDELQVILAQIGPSTSSPGAQSLGTGA